MGRRRELGGDSRLRRSPTSLALTLVALLSLSGCLGLTTRHASLSGTVKIVTPSPAGKGVSPMSLMAEFPRSLSSIPASRPPAASWPTEPSYEYAVEFSREIDRSKIDELIANLGLAYEREGTDGFHIFRDPRRRDPESVIRLLEAAPGVISAEENGWIVPFAVGGDPAFSEQWGLEAIRIEEAWQSIEEAGGAGEVIVAVIDTGFDFTHPDLDSDTLWVPGRDFSDRSISGADYGYHAPALHPDDEHGTGVAGVIGALAGNGVGIRGVAPNVKLMPLKVFWREKERLVTTFDVVARAVHYAVNHGAQVINLSLGDQDSSCSGPIGRALDRAALENVIVIAAAGNTGGSTITCPAVHRSVIAVGSIDRSLTKASHSATGADLDLVAPGGGAGSCILSPSVHHEMKCQVGTSFAAPHVSGVVALMLGKGFPQDPEKVRALLHMTAIRPENRPGRDDRMGYGRLDALGAVSADIPLIMLVEKRPDRLIVKGRTSAGVGGHYQVGIVSEESNRWTVVGWVDVDGDGWVSPGDYYGEYGPVALGKGRSLTGVDFILEPFAGDPLLVE